MRYAVINKETNIVENIIEATTTVAGELEAGLGMTLVSVEGINAQCADVYEPIDGKFYRDGTEVSKIPTVEEQIQAAIDAYTLELLAGGVL